MYCFPGLQHIHDAVNCPKPIGKRRCQEALAADAGLHQALISEIENEAANPELDTIGRIATALGARPRELFEE